MHEGIRPEIDEALCTNCGSCVVACRFAVIEDGPTVDGPGTCVTCGHCVAVCPARAITHPLMDDELFAEMALAPEVDGETLMRFLARRRSVRHYEDREVPDDVIERLVQAAVLAPSAHNAQSWAFTVIRDADRLAQVREKVVGSCRQLVGMLGNPAGRLVLRLVIGPPALATLRASEQAIRTVVREHEAGRDVVTWGAPALVLAHAPRSDMFGGESCFYAMSNLLSVAVAEGLGTCLVGYVTAPAQRDRSLRRLLGVPDDHDLHAAALLGYPAIRFARSVSKSMPDLEII